MAKSGSPVPDCAGKTGPPSRCSHSRRPRGAKGVSGGHDSASTIFPCPAGKSLSLFFNRDDGCKQKITLWPCLFKRASFFVRFEWPFLRPGLGTERRRAQGLSRRAGRPTRSGLVLIAPSTVPCLRRAGVFTVQAPGFLSPFPHWGHGSFRGQQKLPQHGCRGWCRYVPDAVTREGASNEGSAVT